MPKPVPFAYTPVLVGWDLRLDPQLFPLTTPALEIQTAILDEALPDTVSLFHLASETPLSLMVATRAD